MALGGGTFTSQNKQLPGSYLNFISNTIINKSFGERGKVALMLPLNWGTLGEFVEITADNFSEKAKTMLGLNINSDELRPVRDALKNSSKVYVYRKEDVAGNSGAKATSAGLATAKYSGTDGNTIEVEVSELPSGKYQVNTYFKNELANSQTVSTVEQLQDNDLVTFELASLTGTVKTKLSGGTNGTTTNTTHTEFLAKCEKLGVNVVVCDDTNDDVKAIYSEHVKHCRDDLGIKFQVVMYNYSKADYEGVVSVNTQAIVGGTVKEQDLVYWVAGALAGCDIASSCTNKLYDGETPVLDNKSQDELIQAKESGQFVLHGVGNDIRVLSDCNTLQTINERKGDMFKDNKVIRIIDVISDEVSTIFNTQFLGQVPNDEAGRISLWSAITDVFKKLDDMRAIENFDSKDITVEKGDSKENVVINSKCAIIGTMEKLYMTTTIE